ncbi:hypothetical protein [Streptomyces fructofermentans]|uniref:Secreted protein n=1 Tax=Streptomyces fructofermentans TaxID=152141 RepID=A0A918NPW9_9ACTN|nr:hypothetical protein [Streptomyces fructofermentans]GGX85601.1 hypothetical protein GCM10010515_61180 [Streptomyces fructofermentans]
MSTGVIILLIVVAVALVALVAARLVAARGGGGGRGLKRRFGPEYDRVLARHDGDTAAAERELQERVQRHGSLEEKPLEPAALERYAVRWTAVQEQFVDSPRDAVVEADRLIGEVAAARGFPGDRHEDQLDALSVHHAHHVHGFRRVHSAAHTPGTGGDRGRTGSTEDLREALIEARELFDALTGSGRESRGGRRAQSRETVDETPADTGNTSPRGRAHAPWALNKRQVKGS